MSNQNNFILIKGVVLNYPSLLRANTRNKFENSVSQYGTIIILGKDNTDSVNRINNYIHDKLKIGKFNGIENFMSPLKDGDVDYPYQQLYENSFYFYASTQLKPTVVDHKLKPIVYNSIDIQSGSYANVILDFVPYKFNGKFSASAKLMHVQVLPKNKLLELRSNPEDVFQVEDINED